MYDSFMYDNIIQPHAAVRIHTRALIATTWALSVIGYWYLYSSPITPKPGEILQALDEIWWEGDLAYPLWVSWTTNAQALAFTAIIAPLWSYATVVPLLRDVAAAVSGLRFLSLTGLIVSFTLFFESGRSLKVAILVFGMSVFTITQLQDEVRSIPKEELDDARTLRMGPWRTVWEVIVLGKIHTVLVILRQNAAMGWALLTMVEGIARGEGGIGAMILDERKHDHYAIVFAYQLVLLLVGLGQDAVLSGFTRWLCPYEYLKEDR